MLFVDYIFVFLIGLWIKQDDNSTKSTVVFAVIIIMLMMAGAGELAKAIGFI